MGSSPYPNEMPAAGELGRYLSRTEARDIADRLAAGETIRQALVSITPERRNDAALLLRRISDPARVEVLRGIEGARSTVRTLSPLWTLPGPLAEQGRLTTSIVENIDDARSSVICSTYNFQRTSGLWDALRRAAHRSAVHVKVYVDTRAADTPSRADSPTTSEIARHLMPGLVYRTKRHDHKWVRNHAKFITVDHRFLIVTSANMSYSAERDNVEFGLVVDNPILTETVELQMRAVEDLLYEQVVVQ